MNMTQQASHTSPNPEWTRTTLSQVSHVVRGASPRPAGDPRYFNGDFIPWLTVAALTNIPDSQLTVLETAWKLTEAGAQFSRTLSPGTVIIANSGATLGVAKILGIRCCANDGIAALLDLRSDVDARYVVHHINSQTDRLRTVVATGNGQPNLNTGLIGAIEIELPCGAEQSAIADALDAADALIDSLEQLLTKKRQIKQGAMQELLTGKRRLPGFREKWDEATFAEVALIDPENLGSGTRTDFAFNYIALEGVDQGRLISFAETHFDGAPSRARRVLRQGDVLVATVRPNLKSHLLFDMPYGSWIASTGFSVVRCKTGIACPGFLFALLFSSIVERQIDALLTGSNYPAISGRDVANLVFAHPPFEEQVAIAQCLSDMDAVITALESRLTKARALKQAMAQALLTGKIRLI